MIKNAIMKRRRSNTEIENPKSECDMSINSMLPPHIVQVILAKLPIVNLPCCRLVCKAWNDMLLDRASTFKFVQNSIFFFMVYDTNKISPFSAFRTKMYHVDIEAKHANGMDFVALFKSGPKHPCKEIVNFCNGLLCLVDPECMSRCCVLNLMTNEVMELPKDDLDTGEGFWQFCLYGFGFSLKTKQYKIVRLVFKEVITVEIFTLGCSSEWRFLNPVPYHIREDSHGMYLNGSLFWIGEDHSTLRKVLCRFDVEDEKFEAISFPEVASTYAHAVNIDVFNGQLYVNLRDRRKQHYDFVVLMMQRDEGKVSWIRKFVLKNIPEDWSERGRRIKLKLVKISEDGEILFFVKPWGLFLYNLGNGEIERIEKVKNCEWIYETESLNFDSLEKIVAGDGSYM